MTLSEEVYSDVLTAARFLLDDGFSVDASEAIRIGMVLCELAGMMRPEAIRIEMMEPERSPPP